MIAVMVTDTMKVTIVAIITGALVNNSKISSPKNNNN